ncbi:MAG: DUF63 family protein [Candidatus Diapherotrites archaeon]|nr:DUF63 family protein [Candidatus Diapherotrites archaeon]
MWEFIEAYFIRPVYTGEGYNIFNTIAYAVLFIVGLYGVKWLLKKWKIKIGKKLFYALLPYLVLGGLVRALQDAWVVKHWLLITPGIYLMMAGLVIGIIIATGRDLEKIRKVGWVLAAAAVGLVVAVAYSVAFNLQWLLLIVGVAVLVVVLLCMVFRKTLASRENRVVALGQVLDSVASAIPIAFLGYREQHVVSALVMQPTPFLFPLVKVTLVLGALHVIDKDKGDWNWLLKIAIVALGLAPGLRDLARVFIGV